MFQSLEQTFPKIPPKSRKSIFKKKQLFLFLEPSYPKILTIYLNAFLSTF